MSDEPNGNGSGDGEDASADAPKSKTTVAQLEGAFRALLDHVVPGVSARDQAFRNQLHADTEGKFGDAPQEGDDTK